jgi:hypothetical protein
MPSFSFAFFLKLLKRRKIKFSNIFIILSAAFIVNQHSTIELLLFYIRCQWASSALPPLGGIKLAIFGYDYLAPPEIIFELHKNRIITVSWQDRFIDHATFLTRQCFYSYFYISTFSKQAMDNEKIFSVSTSIVGLPHTDFFFRLDNEIKNALAVPLSCKFFCVVLDYFTFDDPGQDRLSPLVNSTGNESFYADIISLARSLPHVFFLIRGKSNNWTKLEKFKKVVSSIASIDNIAIDFDYSNMRSYYLCARANFVIAKYTSMVDECLNYGIPVFIYDFSPFFNRFVASFFNVYGKTILCSNYNELFNNVTSLLLEPNIKEVFANVSNLLYDKDADGGTYLRIRTMLKRLLYEGWNDSQFNSSALAPTSK